MTKIVNRVEGREQQTIEIEKENPLGIVIGTPEIIIPRVEFTV